MNLFNKFMSLKTWQKLGIGIALLTIFKYLTMHNFIINVKAETPTLPNVIISDSITGSNISTSVSSSAPYVSNFISNDDLQKLSSSNRVPMKVSNIVSFIKDSDDSFVDMVSNDYYLTSNSISTFIDRNDETGYFTGFNFYRDDYPGAIRPLEKNHYYTILFQFYTNNVDWTSNSYTLDSFNLAGTFRKYNNSNSTPGSSKNLFNYINISDFNVYVPGMTYTDSHYGFIQFSFYTNDNFPTDYGSSSYYYLESLEFQLNNSLYSANDIVDLDTYKYLFKSDTSGTYKFTSVYILKDVDVFVGDTSYTDTMGGTYINQTIYETCDPLDIACHVRNILTGIKSFTNNIIYSIKQLFNYLFIPDFEVIHDHVEYIRETIDYKYPDIPALIDYKDYFFERLSNIQPQHTISFSGASLPGYNVNIIPAFTFDFDTIINNSTFNSVYVILRAIFTCLVSIGFTLFVFRTFSKIFNNESGGDN